MTDKDKVKAVSVKTEPKAEKKADKPAPKPITVKVLSGFDSINKAIVSLSKRGKAFDKDVHIIAVSALVHADKHGDITLANKLVEALPAIARKNALRDWFIAFGKFDWDMQNRMFTFSKAKATLTQEAINTPFWSFKPEPMYVPFDAVKFLEQAIKRVQNAIKHGDEVPESLVAGLPVLLAQVQKPDVLAA